VHRIGCVDVREIVARVLYFPPRVRAGEPAYARANFERLSTNVVRHAEQLFTLCQRSHMEKCYSRLGRRR
jgi:hypothetical protein